MKNLFIPYELAVTAKKKGFPQQTGGCLGAWDLKDGEEWFYTGAHPVGLLAAPLYQQIVDWFREKHNIHITIMCDRPKPSYFYWLDKLKSKEELQDQGEVEKMDYDSYYQALNKAIEDAFKFIHEVSGISHNEK